MFGTLPNGTSKSKAEHERLQDLLKKNKNVNRKQLEEALAVLKLLRAKSAGKRRRYELEPPFAVSRGRKRGVCDPRAVYIG